MNNEKSDVSSIVIVGGGQAASSAIAKLRGEGYDGQLTLIGKESVAPYQRPPLSKKYLLGKMNLSNIMLRSEEYYTDNKIDLRLNTEVIRIDSDSRIVVLSDGNTVSWDKLLLTTGAIARPLPPVPSDNVRKVFTVRTLDDVDRMGAEFEDGRRLLIIGGGYIGLEAAAVARQRNLHTTLIEAAPRILQRVAAEETSAFFRALHVNNGVDLRENTSVADLQCGSDGAYHVSLNDGSSLIADFIIAGIGVTPDSRLADDAGLVVENGIAVDEFCCTSHPHIYAAGDCASFPWKGNRIRLESVPNAIEQAETAASNMLGAEKIYQPVPWFWSDQYDVKLQIAGLNNGFDKTVVRPGARPGGRSVWYYRDDELLAVDAFNDAPAFMTAKRLLAGSISPTPAEIADSETNLKTLISRSL